MSMFTSSIFPNHEDFFTKISFSTLIGELTHEDNDYMLQEIALKTQHSSASVKIEKDLEKVWSGKDDDELINMILM